MNYKAFPRDTSLRFCNWLLRWPGHPFRRGVLRTFGKAKLGRSTSIERGVELMRRGGLEIGEGTVINSGTLLDSRGGLTIGRMCNISREVMLLTADHDIAHPHFHGREKRVTVGDRAWIATRVIVLPGCTIGDGAVVGAGSVVTRDVPPWTIVAGNPVTVIGSRPHEAQSYVHPFRLWFH